MDTDSSVEVESLRDIIVDMGYKLKVALSALEALEEGNISANPDHAKEIVSDALFRIKGKDEVSQ